MLNSSLKWLAVGIFLFTDITDDASYKIKRELKRRKRNKGIDVNSCLQILMDVTTQMLEPKASASNIEIQKFVSMFVTQSRRNSIRTAWAKQWVETGGK